MGIFRQVKDPKEVVEASPDIVGEARLLGAQAQEYAAAQQATTQMHSARYAALAATTTPAAATPAAPAAPATPSATPATPAAPAGVDFEPIAGVSLELYAQISKGLAAYNYDIGKGPEVAACKGVSAEEWDEAMTGWNDRIKANRSVAQQFNALYMGRACG
jgi:hypothetical protein